MRCTLATATFFLIVFVSSSAKTQECLDQLSADQNYAEALACIKSVLETNRNRSGTEVPELPVGTIIAWYAVNSPVPDGWSICDGNNGTPDLRGKFLRGVGTIADAGNDPEAKSNHRHSATVTDASKANNSHNATCSQGCDDMWASLYNHDHLGAISQVSHIPPNFKVVYLMKTR